MQKTLYNKYKKAQPNWLGKRAFIKHLTTEIDSIYCLQKGD
jgi:hypothetical protein